MGLDPSSLLSEMESPEVAAAIREDILASRRIRQPRGVNGPQGYPAVVINGRYIPRWKFDDEILFNEIFNRVLSGEEPGS